MAKIDRFVYIIDMHFRVSGVKSRTDNYMEALFKKLDWVVEFCHKNSVENLIIGGDMLDNPNVSDSLAGRIARVFRKSKLNVYYVAGNHDITGKNPSTYITGKLHMFESYNFFHFIGDAIGKHVEFDNCILAGIDYDKADEESVDFDMPKECADSDKVKILVVHHMISGDEQDFTIGGKRIIISYNSVNTNADIFLSAHYHPGMKTKKRKVLEREVIFANPGSFARTDKLADKTSVGPSLLYMSFVNKKLMKMKRYMIPHEKGVFVYKDGDDKYSIDTITKGRFLKLLSKFKDRQMIMQKVDVILRTLQADKDLGLPFKITDEIVDMISQKIKEVEDAKAKNQ